MSNKFKDLQKLLIPSDIMPIGMMLIGIIISIFISEIAIKLIGISISILGLVVLLMKLTTRMSSAIETKFKSNPPPNFKITVKKSPEAKRQVIENFENENDDLDSNVKQSEDFEIKTAIPKVKKETKTMGDDEGFRIVSKNKEPEVIAKESSNENTPNNETKVESNRESIAKENKNELNSKSEESISANKFRKREINIPTHGLLEEMPIFKDHPDKEFELFINRILMAIRSVSNTRTAAFFFYNAHKNEIILNSVATESKKIAPLKSKYSNSNDIISQIANSMKPEILTDINPAAELDLLPYYTSNSGTNSFIGIPVIYDKNVIGVLTADSKHTDAYDTFMVNFLSHFTKLISGLIRSYSDKYDLAQDSKYLKNIIDLDKLSFNTSIPEIHSNLVSKLNSLIDTRNIYSIEYLGDKNQFKIISVANKTTSDFEEEFTFHNEDSLLSESISMNTEIYESNPDDLVRVNKNEDFCNGYFYSVPLSTTLEKYGAVVIEGNSNSILSKDERSFINSLVRKTADNIEKLKLYQIVQTGFDKDPISGLLTESSILKELEKEIIRCGKFNYNSSVVTICFDEYQSIDNTNKHIYDSILSHINDSLKTTIESLDYIGRIENNLVVLLSNKNAQAAKLWAERVRNKIASESIYISEKRINITISIGICDFGSNSKPNLILDQSRKALEVSKSKSNTVSVFD